MVKAKLKKNIRAQRKFAQGAFVPPQISSIASAASKFNRSATVPSTPGPIIQNEINPTDFIGRLSLQRIHVHSDETSQCSYLEPKVFLTRFTSTPTPNPKPAITPAPAPVTKARKTIVKKTTKRKYTPPQKQNANTRKVSSSDSSEENQPLINFTNSPSAHDKSNNNDISIRTEGYATRSTAADKRETALPPENSSRTVEKTARKYRASESPSNFKDLPVPELFRAIRFERVRTIESPPYSSASEASEFSDSSSSMTMNDDEGDPDFEVTKPYSSASKLIKRKTPVNVTQKKKPIRGRKRGRPAQSESRKAPTPIEVTVEVHRSESPSSEEEMAPLRISPDPIPEGMELPACFTGMPLPVNPPRTELDECCITSVIEMPLPVTPPRTELDECCITSVIDAKQNKDAERTSVHTPSADPVDRSIFKTPDVPVWSVLPTPATCATRQFICLENLVTMSHNFSKDVCNLCCRCILVKKYAEVLEELPLNFPEEPDVLDESEMADYAEEEACPDVQRRGRELVKSVMSRNKLIYWLSSSITVFKKSMFIEANQKGVFYRNIILPKDDDDVIHELSGRLDYILKCLEEDRNEVYAHYDDCVIIDSSPSPSPTPPRRLVRRFSVTSQIEPPPRDPPSPSPTPPPRPVRRFSITSQVEPPPRDPPSPSSTPPCPVRRISFTSEVEPPPRDSPSPSPTRPRRPVRRISITSEIEPPPRDPPSPSPTPPRRPVKRISITSEIEPPPRGPPSPSPTSPRPVKRISITSEIEPPPRDPPSPSPTRPRRPVRRISITSEIEPPPRGPPSPSPTSPRPVKRISITSEIEPPPRDPPSPSPTPSRRPVKRINITSEIEPPPRDPPSPSPTPPRRPVKRINITSEIEPPPRDPPSPSPTPPRRPVKRINITSEIEPPPRDPPSPSPTPPRRPVKRINITSEIEPPPRDPPSPSPTPPRRPVKRINITSEIEPPPRGPPSPSPTSPRPVKRISITSEIEPSPREPSPPRDPSPPRKARSSKEDVVPVPCTKKIRLLFPVPLRPAKKAIPNPEPKVKSVAKTKKWLEEIAKERRSASDSERFNYAAIVAGRRKIYPSTLELPIDLDISNYINKDNRGRKNAEPSASVLSEGCVVDAPIYHPTVEDFRDPIEYIKRIEPVASSFGICKIVPPEGFKIPCHLDEAVVFRTTNQNVGRMYQRWGHASKELAIIQIHVAMSEKFPNTKVPMFEGVEVDLLKLHHLVQQQGGLQEMMGDKEKWASVAEKMSLVSQRGRGRADDKLQKIYMRHVLPYASLTADDHAKISVAVDRVWQERVQRNLVRARRPMHILRRLLGEPTTSDEDGDRNTSYDITTVAIRKIGKPMFDRIEECTTKGQTMNLQMFRRVANQLHSMHFPNNPHPSVKEVEELYWDIVTNGNHHVCVQTAAIDTSANNLGHESDRKAPGGNHPWNLKRIGSNPLNILRSLRHFLSVTVPTLGLNQLFSTNCWHMDPHKLSWTDVMHEGSTKIWYAVARQDEAKFRAACETLVPYAVQNKGLWLPSDTAMVPLSLLMLQGCRLQRVEQNPGEFIVVFPGAYASSISTGMSISESIYFEDKSWLSHIDKIFQDLRLDCEPAMFSSADLLMRMTFDKRIDTTTLPRVYDSLKAIVDKELAERRQARRNSFFIEHRPKGTSSTPKTWPYQEECTTCRVPLVLSKSHRPEDPRQLLCLQHGLQLWELVQRSRSLRLVPPDLVLMYTDSQLKQLLEALLVRIELTREDDSSS